MTKQKDEKGDIKDATSSDQEFSWPEVRKILHESMKRTSDYAGAILRLGLLTVLITFLVDRISRYSFMRDGYFLSLGSLIVVLCAVWMALAIKIFVYTFANLAVILVPYNLVENPAFKVDPKIGLLKKVRLHVRNGLRLWVLLFLGGVVIGTAIHASIAAFYELAAFVDRSRP